MFSNFLTFTYLHKWQKVNAFTLIFFLLPNNISYTIDMIRNKRPQQNHIKRLPKRACSLPQRLPMREQHRRVPPHQQRYA